jgi:hypothetical protein
MSTQPIFQAYIQRVNEIEVLQTLRFRDDASERLLDCYEQVKAEFDNLQPDFTPSVKLSNLFASVREMQADLEEQDEETNTFELRRDFQTELKAFLELLVSELSTPAAPSTPIKREETPEPPAAPVKRPRDNDVDADELLSVSKRLFAQQQDVEVIDLTTDEDD